MLNLAGFADKSYVVEKKPEQEDSPIETEQSEERDIFDSPKVKRHRNFSE